MEILIIITLVACVVSVIISVITLLTQKRLAEMCGLKSQGTVGGSLNNKIMAGTMLKWIDKMGYEVVIQPKQSGKRRDGAIVLEPDPNYSTGCQNNGKNFSKAVLEPSGLPDGRGKKQKKEVESAE